MLFLRVGNGQNLFVLSGPHDVIGDPQRGPWVLKRWDSTIGGLMIGGERSETLPRREYGVAGIVPPFGSLGVIVSWNHQKNRPGEILLLSSIEQASFYYKDLVVSIDREAFRVSGFKTEWRFDAVYDRDAPQRVSAFVSANHIPQRIPSLDDLRTAMQRTMFGDFIDRRGPEATW